MSPKQPRSDEPTRSGEAHGGNLHIFRYLEREATAQVQVDGRTVFDETILPSQTVTSKWGFTTLPNDGRPYVLNPDGSLHPFLNDFVRYARDLGISYESCHSYLIDLRQFGTYLDEVYGLTLLEAKTEHVGAYSSARVDGFNFKLSGSSWQRHRASLNRFYDFATDPEIQLLSTRPRITHRGGLTEVDTIRSITITDYIKFRNVGMLGLTPGGAPDTNFRGRFPLRNAAFVELGVTSGMRLMEESHLLLCELPQSTSPVFLDQRQFEFRLTGLITKRSKTRNIPLSQRVLLKFIEPYVREERAAAVFKWRLNRFYEDRNVIFGVLLGDGRIKLNRHQKPRPIASLTKNERMRLAILPEMDAPIEEAEPAALWLGEQGKPLARATWQSIIKRALYRVRKLSGFNPNMFVHMLRHTFAVYTLNCLIRAAFSVLDDQDRARSGIRPELDALHNRNKDLYMKVTLDPCRRLQRWLGHATFEQTQKYLDHVDEAIEMTARAGHEMDLLLDEKA